MKKVDQYPLNIHIISNVILDVLTGRKELIRIKLIACYTGDDNNNSKTEIRADLVAMTKRSLRVLCACSRVCTNPSDTQARVPLRKPQQITNHILADCQKVASESFLSEGGLMHVERYFPATKRS